jgi:hypothetical protein
VVKLEFPIMEYEVSIRVKVDPDYFYMEVDAADRQATIADQVKNILYDIEDIKIKNITAEELE